MSTVIEYTMFVKPEAFDEVMKAYVEFADAFGVENPSEDLILVTGDRDGGVIRGIGIFEDDMEAEIAVDESIFVRFRERIAPHLTEEPIPARRRKASVSKGASDLVTRMMAKEKEIRFQNPRALADEVEAVLAQRRREAELRQPPVGRDRRVERGADRRSGRRRRRR
ncbi:MAG: hypothetical protein ACO21P_03385 [Candidatus Nanopelagicales bacterium]